MFMLPLLFALLLPAPTAVPSIAVDDDIKEWVVPWENSRPRDPFMDQQGRVWFCGQKSNYIAYLDPAAGTFKRYELPENTHPHNLIIDGQGMVWYAGNTNAHIGKLDPDTGEIVQYPMPDPAARDPHTLVFTRTGDIWFTVQGGNFIGRLTTKTGKVDLVKVPTPRARPYGIKMDAQDRPWVVLFGSHKFATVDPATLELEEIALPREEIRPRRMEITPDGGIWYVDYAGGMLGRLDAATREVQEWPLPSGAPSRPYGTASDAEGRIWVAETGVQPNRLVGFDPVTKTFFQETDVPSGGGTVRHMYYHAPTREIWFGADSNRIGRLTVPKPES